MISLNTIIFLYKVFIGFLVIAGLFSIYLEIKNSKDGYWFLSRVDILEKTLISQFRIETGSDISFLDLIFDLYYVISNKKTTIFFTTLLALYAFKWVTLIFFTIFLWNNLTIIFSILYCIIFNKKKIISFEVNDFSPNDSALRLLYLNIRNIKIWSFLVVYAAIGLKTNKLNLVLFEKYVTLLFLGFPSWYIKFIIDFLCWIFDLIKDGVWRRKYFRAWPSVLLEKIKFKLFDLMRISLFRKSFTVDKLKIYIENRKIRLNPNELPAIMLFVKTHPEIFCSGEFLNVDCSLFYGRSHQFFKSSIPNCGYSMTSGDYVWIGQAAAKTKIETTPLGKQYSHQKMIFSHVDQNNLIPGVSAGFWQTMQLYNYKNYAGFIIRLRILHCLDVTECVILQDNDGGQVINSEKKIYTKWLYCYYMSYYLNPTLRKYFSNHVIHEYNKNIAVEAELRKSIIFELGFTPNTDLFELVYREYSGTLALSLLEKELRNSYKIAMEKPNFI